MMTGGAARAAQEAEIIRQKEADERRASGVYMPFRFYMKYPETKEIIVLDAQPGPCFYEHSLKNPRTDRWDITELCPKTFEPCPICSGEVKMEGAGKESYYVMMLTVMDMTPYFKNDKRPGAEAGAKIEVPYSRKLLAVKAADQGFFIRQFDRKGTLRGMHLLMARDSKDVSSIGRPELQLGTEENPDFNGFHSDEAIMDSFGSPEVKDTTSGKVIKQANVDCYAFDYGKLFSKPDGATLRKKYHVGGVPGSASANSASLHDHSGHSHASGANTDVGDDDIPF
jgi:hypothetical protein